MAWAGCPRSTKILVAVVSITGVVAAVVLKVRVFFARQLAHMNAVDAVVPVSCFGK